jgi:hypothetical protein
MDRLKFLLLILIFVFLVSSCTQAPQSESVANEPVSEEPIQQTSDESNLPVLPEVEVERETLEVFVDGQPIKESGYTYADIKSTLADNIINETTYYSALIQYILGMDLSSVKGAFLEAVDGYISYVSDVNNLYLAAYKEEDGQYASVELDGKAVYAGVTPGGKDNKGVVKVYLVTTPADFEVEIQRNGEKIGVITLKEFMQKTEVGDKKVATEMFDGSYLYNAGESTYSGRFLGISYETMLAKLTGMGLDLSGNIIEVEYYGTNGLENIGKNFEYSTDPESDKYFGLVDFYCMYDGKTFNSDTAQKPVGLTAFINGTGGRWMTMSLNAINFIFE